MSRSEKREPVLLVLNREYEFFADVDPAADRLRVPRLDGIEKVARGVTFRRTTRRDEITGRAIFVPETRQL